MNIEEILNKIYTSDLLSSEELHELTEWIREPKDRIDEAIEYLEKNKTIFNAHNVIDDFGIPTLEFTLEPWKKELLDILQGSEEK